MKKLMIAAAIICTAVMSQAANYVWSTARSTFVNAMNGTDVLASSQVCLFYATDAQTVYDNWNNGQGSLASMTSLDNTSTTSAGAISTKDPISLDVAALNAVIAAETTIGGTKYLFISGAASKGSVSPGNAGVSFTSTQLAASKEAATKWASGGYAGAGWYSASVPEPTSGLMLLLGVAGLALRRRRA